MGPEGVDGEQADRSAGRSNTRAPFCGFDGFADEVAHTVECRCAEAIAEAAETIAGRPVRADATGPFSLAGRLMDVSRTMYHCDDERG